MKNTLILQVCLSPSCECGMVSRVACLYTVAIRLVGLAETLIRDATFPVGHIEILIRKGTKLVGPDEIVKQEATGFVG